MTPNTVSAMTPTRRARKFAEAVSSARLHDATNRVVEADDDNLIIETVQEIPDDFMTDLADARHESTSNPIGDFALYARIPQWLANKWYREGWKIHEMSLKEIDQRLRREQTEYFIATRKRLFA